MKKLLIFLFFISNNLFSQNILWTNVNKDDVLPSIIKIEGKVKITTSTVPNISTVGDIYIDTENEIIYYIKDDIHFNLYKNEFDWIKIDGGNQIDDDDVFGDFGDTILSNYRKNLYEKAELNIVSIVSVRKDPDFFILESGNLDVANKEVALAKILSISPYDIEFIDSTGSVVSQSNIKKRTIEGADAKTKRKESRKKTRILNISFGGKHFFNISELYSYFYDDYKTKFYDSQEDFRSFFIGKKLSEILRLWGPYTEEFEIQENSKMYVWSFIQKITESEMNTRTSSSSLSSSVTNTTSQINASLMSDYGININASKVNIGNYSSVIDAYGNVRGSSFLKYYQTNIINQFSSTSLIRNTTQKATSIERDITKKIALLVDNNLIVKEILEKNYFVDPYYGVKIMFYK